MTGGDWLTDLPPESEDSDVPLEDELDPSVLDMALRVERGQQVLNLADDRPLDQPGYDRALRENRRGQRPPHLRKGTDEQRCGNCGYYDGGEKLCDLYTYPTTPGNVCDEWEAE